jgi:hypothetical protein
MQRKKTSSIIVPLLLVVFWLVISCTQSHGEIKLPGGGVIFMLESQVKVKIGSTVFPDNGSIMGFMLDKNHIYGWYSNKHNASSPVYFIINLYSGNIQEGSFYQIKEALSTLELNMPNMSDELTYSFFLTKTEKELQKRLAHKDLKLKRTKKGFSIDVVP